ncbi:hypothetical protein [Engelhardtia mirabilis]|uniref:Uncharacterized protein n=1 Tax=Engelhardtia mirabilis TaxID=2528011 RepID=A0A518BFD2_9BACT|nr:hypothetical protein Pla133_07530 [Planctomycetes bacterium Pla133]QDV00014.1 hypothetical protein Pla86_07520 [Planctomycetes bacterium Pla86]
MTLPILFAALQSGQLWVVDDELAHGADFAQITEALAVATDDDAILVREGVYDSFELIDRGARIFSLANERPVVLGTVKVRGQRAGQSVVLDGLRVVAGGVGLLIDNAQEPVWLEDLLVQVYPQFHVPLPALVVYDCADVVMAAVHVGPALESTDVGTGGAQVTDSVLHIYDSHFEASASASATPVPLPGMSVGGSVVFASGTTFVGADGWSAALDGLGACTNAGDGQPGLIALSSKLLESEVKLIDCTFVGGEGGLGLGSCPAGEVGPAQSIAPESSVAELEVQLGARSYDVTSVIGQGQTGQIHFQGSPGEVVANYIGLMPNPVFQADVKGSFGALGSILVFQAGVLDGHGQLTQNLQLVLPHGFSYLDLYAQGIFVSFVDGIVLGTPRAVLFAAP